MSLIQRAQTDFENDTYDFIRRHEAVVRRVYDDGRNGSEPGVPTLGVGYALVVNIAGVWQLRGRIDEQLATVGITLTADDRRLLERYAAVLNGSGTLTEAERISLAQVQGSPYPEEPYATSVTNNKFSFLLTSNAQIRSLYDVECLARLQARRRSSQRRPC